MEPTRSSALLLQPWPWCYSGKSSQVFRHPKYNSFTINNDITLIKLASPAQLGVRVSPVCVAETADVFSGGMKCVTSGWGLTRYNGQTWNLRSRRWDCWAQV